MYIGYVLLIRFFILTRYMYHEVIIRVSNNIQLNGAFRLIFCVNII